MVRETRHLWVGNLPDNIREDRVREHFKRYGRVQSVKLLPRGGKEETGEMACTVAFMDIKSASKAHTAEHKLDDRTLTTEYYEPAAIPSSTSPPNASAGYSTTSPSSTRFPNGHSSTDEHANFTDRFYDRTNSARAPPDAADYLRRTSAAYHETGRGRNRDRTFRNGPYNSVERHQRTTTVNSTGSGWTYDARYNNDTGYSAATGLPPSATTTPTEQSTKKCKSRSGSRTPSASASSRSPSRSRSRSSSSSSSSSGSRATSSTGSPKSRRPQSGNAAVSHQTHADDRRPQAICVRNLPLRSSDTSLKDGLFHEYKKHGKVTWVKVVGQSSERHAIVCFKKPEDVEKAIEVSYDKMFFGSKIEVSPHQGYDVEDNDLRPYEAQIDEFHPKATRTLFIGNLEKDVTASDLRKHFDQFGDIIEIDIKKQGSVSSYAFCQYSDIVSVVKAIRTMDGEHLNNNRINLGFGKSMPTPCVWVDGVGDTVTDKYLSVQFDPFGVVGPTFVDREKGQALVFFDQVVNAQTAVNKMRGVSLRGRKIQVDFASRECQEAFFENLEKQGLIFERPGFEERRDSTSRSFESLGSSGRFSRYETPTRPRTASYSSRSGAPTGQCNATAIPSPGTPGSATPRGAGSRSRLSRYEYFDQTNSDYPERHLRSYDEYSQGSAASHEDAYEHEYVYHESPSHLELLDARLQTAAEHVMMPFAQPDIRNLQKERVLLLEQLEECPSSGDELIGPKKRLKLEHLDGTITSDVIIEANRDHRKVMEVRRSSDASLKHLSRRPSADGKHVGHDRGSYMPHAVCKRRKTAGSDGGGRAHHYESSESVGGSRPGTPLCDERPEHFAPTEPRRVPREREGPLTLPLPRFASQLLGRGGVSVAGIKGQKENVLSSPPPAVTSPRISNPKPPSPTPVPPPASPPPRPPSLSSNSSDSDGASPTPSLDERIRSLDEKYEKWSGSRAHASTAGVDALAKLDLTRERFKFRHKLLDLDLKEVQPSEIVKSVMAKRSVFDEDSKRLENVGEKYEPKDFSLFPTRTTPVTVQTTTVPATALPTLPLLKVCTNPPPKTPTMLSPRSSGAALTPAKGLQYPFPSHPPMQPSPSSVVAPPLPPPPTTTPSLPTQPPPPPPPPPTTAPTTPSSTTTTTQQPPTSTTPRSAHGENRLKSCATAPSDNWTPSKVNRSVSSGVVVSNKSNSDANKNIPPHPPPPATTATVVVERSTTPPPPPPATQPSEVKTKTNKVLGRRDSSANNNNGESRSSRRNSRTDDVGGSSNENCDSAEADRLERARLDNERTERENAERDRLERERLERERTEREREERERVEKERVEKERLERERIERDRLERERIERERMERERMERERIERERIERERIERERIERERSERERKERERREREERERREREEKEHEQQRLEKERRKEKDDEQERRREQRDDERRHGKDDNHEQRRNEHRHRENHKDDKRDNSKKDDKRYVDRDAERRKESVKENRDNNMHEKTKHLFNEIREGKDRPALEHHLSVEEKKSERDPSRRKERNNSLPASLGGKRRMSSHELDFADDVKKIKLSVGGGQEHRKISERRDSASSGKTKHKNSSKYDDKSRHNHIKETPSTTTTTTDEKRKDREHRDERHKNKQLKIDKQKAKSKNRDKESPSSQKKSRDSPPVPSTPLMDKEFLLRLDLVEVEKQKQQQQHQQQHRKEEKRTDERKKEQQQQHKREETPKSSDEQHQQQQRAKQLKKDRIRKFTNSSDNSDSDEPKKHSIFDIVDDEPAYISMYDKVKARSCKNMQKQEEEKRQEKIKAKFSQLKQSRAKREEKKRSTSWDEDSDSEHEKCESTRRNRNKMLIASSDDEDVDDVGTRKQIKKEMFTDSDSDRNRCAKSEIADSSDDDRMKVMQGKGSKSRITSDTSDDEYKKEKIKSELFSDNEDQGFADSDEKYKKIKEEYEEKFIKKERKNNKISELNQQIFGDSNSPEVKEEKFNNARRPPYDSSADESAATAGPKLDSVARKKHKKKQKRQKNSPSSEDCTSAAANVVVKLEPIEHDAASEKKAGSDKKKQHHGKKDKKRDKTKDEGRSKKSKKSKSDGKELLFRRDDKIENIFGPQSDDSDAHKDVDGKTTSSSTASAYADRYDASGDSDAAVEPKTDEKERSKVEEKERLLKEEHRKRKVKKRREKEKQRLREEQLMNENSMDYVDLGKRLEENIKDDSNDVSGEVKIKFEIEVSRPETVVDDVFRLDPEAVDVVEARNKDERKEAKEKKKKRKKSKDEKQRHHHHHHHHDKGGKAKSPEIKKETTPVAFLPEPPQPPPPPPPPTTTTMTAALEMPSIQPQSPPPPPPPTLPDVTVAEAKTSSSEKKRDKFIIGFGAEIDEKVHENAVKSISEFEPPKTEPTPAKPEAETKTEKVEAAEEKPRTEISQEETEDAVAALLGESFGSGQCDDFYDEPQSPGIEQTATPDNAQDDEEMRQAVRSLGSSNELEIKPDTPQSENDLQIDTDTEEQDEAPTRYDAPRTPDAVDFSQPPKTPDIPSYFRKEAADKSMPNIGSPPSLTPIKPVEAKRTLTPAEAKPTWPDNKVEKPIPPAPSPPQQPQPVKTKPEEKVALDVPPLKPVVKPTPPTPPAVSISMHNMPAQMPFPVPKDAPKPVGLPVSRLPITSVMVSKPIQPTTLVLPKAAQAQKERPRMVYHHHHQYPGFASQPRMIIQQRPPALVANRQLTPTGVFLQQTTTYDKPRPEPPKLITSYALPQRTEPPKLSYTAPSIIIASTAASGMKPFMPVIQEAPKLVSLSPTVPQPTIIQTVSKTVPTPPTLPTPPTPQPVKEATVEVAVEKKEEQKAAPQNVSTPSPVIVATPKVEVVEEKPKTPEPPPKPLAIEKVTEELNMALKKSEEKDEPAKAPPFVPEVKVEKIEPVVVKKEDEIVKVVEPKPEPETVSVIREIEKFDDEKADTESTISDLSKEHHKDEHDPLDSKEDSDYWSAKEVNIDSVIKKVDLLCSPDELSDRSSDVADNEAVDEKEVKTEAQVEKTDDGKCDVLEAGAETPTRGRRGGRRGGRKARGGVVGGVQTRRGKVVAATPTPTTTTTTTTTPRGRATRGARVKPERKVTKSESEDIYEFHDEESDESQGNKERPRLILTIKSPTVTNAAAASLANATTVVKEVVQPPVKPVLQVAPPTKPPLQPAPTKPPLQPAPTPQPPPKQLASIAAPTKPAEEFTSPANTRKSRRLLERDVSRNTVDDTIEDVVKSNMVTRAAASAASTTPRRSARQTKPTTTTGETNRKSPRAGKKKDRRASENTDDSSEERFAKCGESDVKDDTPKVEVKEKPHEGLKAAVLRRVMESSQEPMTLIDPVTGLLTPMRECEEGRYVPAATNAAPTTTMAPKLNETTTAQTPSVITTQVPQQPVVVVKSTKPQSLKHQILLKAKSEQQQVPTTAATAAAPTTATAPASAVFHAAKPVNVNVSLPTFSPAHLSPKPSLAAPSPKPTTQGVKVIQPPISPNVLPKQIVQQVTIAIPKTSLVSSSPAVVNTQMAHVKAAPLPNKSAALKPHIVQASLAGASPPLKQHLIQGANARLIGKPGMEPPKVDVQPPSTTVMVPRSNASPQNQQQQQRHIMQTTGIPLTGYEASLGDGIAHFTPGSVPLRPHDMHYLHPPQLVYQQYLRQSYHLSKSAMGPGGLEKPGDGQEGEEAPVTSPPLELRRTGPVGLPLTGRPNSVPHSIQSPHDRATDSPQVGQVYMHPNRMHLHANRYYEPSEPPPAHRPLTSHSGSLAALGSDHPLGHMGALGTADRPLSTHSALGAHMASLPTPDRPLSTHLPDRTLSAHLPDRMATHISDRSAITTHLPDRSITGFGAVLGAAGNIMGAVARHVGADAPASQRGLQAATPPHASQVPPQAESLLMLLKQYPLMWQGLLALKNDQAAVQMYFVSGNDSVAKMSLPKNIDGSTPPLRIFQRMRLEPPQVEGVARKMQMENEHCMLLALPCGHDHMDVLKQSTNLTHGFITYLQQKQAAGIVNVAAPGTTQPPAYVVHIFPSCDFVNENLRRIAPSLLERVADIAHLLIVITTV